ncbi:hypothetical protein PsYK624_004380 [Phanerochaete sordida]|uniref:Uncharacterized protein n=1 Tax=Phanerochaete sordida TaxID=48140 RepID=A0A9P3FXL2_9APHY|nr:hypothetical protein PsYK624_004380 [Phanerochaete sordida]
MFIDDASLAGICTRPVTAVGHESAAEPDRILVFHRVTDLRAHSELVKCMIDPAWTLIMTRRDDLDVADIRLVRRIARYLMLSSVASQYDGILRKLAHEAPERLYNRNKPATLLSEHHRARLSSSRAEGDLKAKFVKL